jgi:hypothetical protein
MSVGGHQLALPGPGNERAVTSLKGNELKKRRRRIKVKRTNFGPSQKEKAEPVGPSFIDDAELRVSSV